MGHHYVPREYLKGFQCPTETGMIWMYDKKDHRYVFAPIKKVAQEPKFYSEENERLLNELVEGPANDVFRKLRRRQHMDDQDRAKLVTYVGTMLMRGPWRRTKSMRLLPDVARRTLDDFEPRLLNWAESATNKELVARRLAEFKVACQSVQDDPAQGITDYIRQPWATERMLAVIDMMTWRIMKSPGTERFLTSDNPVWYDEGRGMNKPESELVFPISSETALFGSWQGGSHQTLFGTARAAVVREANRRTVSRAVRFVYFPDSADWIRRLAQKPRLQLNQIRWAS